MRLPTTILLAALVAGAPAGAQSTGARLTLEDAFERALAANPQVRVAADEIRAANARHRYARSFVLPKVAVTGNLTRNNEEVAFGSGEDASVILPENDWAYRLSVRQPIFAGLRDLRAIGQARLAIDRAELGLVDARNDTLLLVGVDYLAMVEAESVAQVEERNLELARGRLLQASDFYEVGEVTRIDVLRAEAAIKAAERQLVTARAAGEAAEARLRVALALEGEIDGERPAGLLPPLPGEPELVASALASSPVVEQARVDVAVAELEVKRRRGAYFPTLFAEAAWIEQRSGFPSDSYGLVALNLDVPLFRGGEVRSQVDEARVLARQAVTRLEDVERAIRENVRTALLDVETARAVLELAREEEAAAEVEHGEAFELYRAQEATSLDVEAAELALADARRRVVSAETDLWIAELQAWYLTGGLVGLVRPGPPAEKGYQP